MKAKKAKAKAKKPAKKIVKHVKKMIKEIPKLKAVENASMKSMEERKAFTPMSVAVLRALLAEIPEPANVEVWFENDKTWGAFSGIRMVDQGKGVLLMKGN